MNYAQPTHHGPRFLENGKVEFRLWSPSAKSVLLLLEGEKRPMQDSGGGWRACTAEASAGQRYQFLINGELAVPDPASRFQPKDVHGPSELVDPRAFHWPDHNWQGRPWEDAVVYELHPGCFSPTGDFSGIAEKLDYLKDLGITAIELMPVADFEGQRGWGYDGVLPYAPNRAYGRPHDLKRLIASAHERGLMVLLDVVYNHFGPSGNYLHTYAKQFFTDRYHTPWGAAIDFTHRPVRDFFVDNALYWLNEYRFDGLRFDAIHAIVDAEDTLFLKGMASRIRAECEPGRHIHLILENDANEAHYLSRQSHAPLAYTAQWNDDFHHVMHRLISGETGGYYRDYDNPVDRLGRCLTQGFDYQGEPSIHRDGMLRGEPSTHLPPVAFVNFLQNHDQIGNRAFGERISTVAEPDALKLATVALLLSPAIPMLFMGEEWAAMTPFLYFCDFHDELADAVREGRRREFASFPEFADPEKREQIPDPNALGTFAASRLNWGELEKPMHRDWLSFTTELLALRHRYITPLLQAGKPESRFTIHGSVIQASWQFSGQCLQLTGNFSAQPAAAPQASGTLLYGKANDTLAPWQGFVTLAEG